LDEKPGFRSYLKQFSIVLYTTKDTDTGVIYEEINAKTHRIAWTIAFILVYAAIAYFLICELPVAGDGLFAVAYIVGAVLAAAAYYIGSIRYVYSVSGFEIIGKEEINKYLDIKF
jgi:hypothetical protein